MKTFVLAIFTLLFLSFSSNEKVSKDKYLIPEDTKKAAFILNEAFATPFKEMKFKAQPENVSFVNKKELLLIIEKSSLSDKIRKDLLVEIEKNWKEIRATILEIPAKLCDDQSSFIAVLEGQQIIETDYPPLIFTTCGIIRCILLNPSGYGIYNCNYGNGTLKTVQLCSESSVLCCTNYYCWDKKCPTYNCMEKQDCPNCN